MRAEVGLVTRNVVIQGDDNSDSQLLGVHTAIMEVRSGGFVQRTKRACLQSRMPPVVQGGIFHMENAEIRRCGQGFLLGRYCTHFVSLCSGLCCVTLHKLHEWRTLLIVLPPHRPLQHEAGLQEQSYVRFNSIHHSYQRATTVHDTDRATVKHNFAYRIHGHSIFVEDGNEQWNVIDVSVLDRLLNFLALFSLLLPLPPPFAYPRVCCRKIWSPTLSSPMLAWHLT